MISLPGNGNSLLDHTVLGRLIALSPFFSLIMQNRRFYEWQGYLLETKKTIPMAFVLGFYVTLVVNRWWQQFQLLPWPDTMAILVSAAISPPEVLLCGYNNSIYITIWFFEQSENKDEGRMMRRTIMRYTVLAYVLTLMKVSLRARKRFPSYRHVINAGE